MWVDGVRKSRALCKWSEGGGFRKLLRCIMNALSSSKLLVWLFRLVWLECLHGQRIENSTFRNEFFKPLYSGFLPSVAENRSSDPVWNSHYITKKTLEGSTRKNIRNDIFICNETADIYDTNCEIIAEEDENLKLKSIKETTRINISRARIGP